jgi:hypothetical protein
MVEGFWIAQFEGVQGTGGGVVFFIKGRIFGGDSGFVYTGTYQTDEKTITGIVKVRTHSSSYKNSGWSTGESRRQGSRLRLDI